MENNENKELWITGNCIQWETVNRQNIVHCRTPIIYMFFFFNCREKEMYFNMWIFSCHKIPCKVVVE